MTFKSVIVKNFKGSFHKYFAYFLSSGFSVMLFFMYATLILNKDLSGREDTTGINYIFPVTMISISLFSIFFINYAHTAFIKGRNKEFGVFITLGMSSRELMRLVNIENLLIGTFSILAGMGVGSLFSRLFQMVILSLLDISDIHFYLSYRPFLLTASAFALIFATVMIRTFIKMRKIDIATLLKEDKKGEGKKYSKKDLILGSLGLCIMAGSIVLLVTIANNEDLNSNPMILLIYMAVAFLGVYLSISKLGNLLLHVIRKSRFYYRNILSITELHHKFNQNKKIIFVLSVLSTMTVYLVASPFSLLSLCEDIASIDRNHLEYVETTTINRLSEGTLDQLLSGQEITDNRTVKFIFVNTQAGSKDLSTCKPIISADEYNSLIGTDLKVSEGEAYNIIYDWMPGKHGIEPDSIHSFYLGNNEYSYRFIDSMSGKWIAGMEPFPADAVIVINQNDYNELAAAAGSSNIAYYHLINFKNWKTSKDTVTALRAQLGESILKVASVVENYEALKRIYSVFLFMSTVLGIMFFVAGGSVLYFKQYTELEEAKKTFRKLNKIGISSKEIKSIVGKELMAIFFLPLVFGAFLGFSLIYLTTYIVGGNGIIREFLSNASIVVIIYFISQGIFYYITKNKYVHEIVKTVG